MAAAGERSRSAGGDRVRTAPTDQLRAVVAARLAAADVPSPDADARWLVEAATEPTESTEPTRPSDDAGAMRPSGRRAGAGAGPGDVRDRVQRPDGVVVDRERLERLVARRVAREPLQVILGTTAFRHLTLTTRSGVFVPRPETEVVAGAAIAAAGAVTSPPARVVDACTGSGTIALAVASEVPGVQVVATEVDPDALDLARSNLQLLQARPSPSAAWRPGDWLAPRASVHLVAGNLLDAVDADWRGTVDVLVSNPPYLPAADKGSWQPEVANHDPERSLVGGIDGHEIVQELLALAGEWLRPGGSVIVEIDDRRGQDALAAAERAGLVDCRLVVDLTGRDRAVVGRRPADAVGG